MIRTERLVLRPWRADDYEAFARMHADSDVMADLGGAIDKMASGAKLDRYRRAYQEQGLSRWAVEDTNGVFVGYSGVMPRLSNARTALRSRLAICSPRLGPRLCRRERAGRD